MIGEIVEMVSRIPQGIMIGFCVFLFVTVIVIILLRMVSGLQLIKEEIRGVNINLNDIKKELDALTFAVKKSDQGSP